MGSKYSEKTTFNFTLKKKYIKSHNYATQFDIFRSIPQKQSIG
jgi:hypothetical protein